MPPRPKKFICTFCRNEQSYIDYKNSKLLSGFITYYRSMQSRFHTGVCLKHQKQLANAIKKSRIMALLPFVRYEKKK
ncbi:30S ribosomal protein S18 [Candidatus Gracilibacteria bacterium]|nr:30S ribosomal protein S18 [Candidatus Gracilibacteria bacterium]